MILQECPKLQILIIDDCFYITDSSFQAIDSPFTSLKGLRSLQKVSMKRCMQIKGLAIQSIVKNGDLLTEIDLEGCKGINPEYIESIWTNLSYCNLNKVSKDISIPFQNLNSNIPLSVLNLSYKIIFKEGLANMVMMFYRK